MNPKDTQIGGNHYTKMKIQPMEFSMANNLNPMQHTIIKYVTRVDLKGNGDEDIDKAIHTLQLWKQWRKDNGHKATD
ncbi:hypothetical protein MEP301_gp47 [Methylophilales phage MEP301]|nr:hypothetical protein MEP301_gp47 [Methylophilales phage MEP301]